MNKSLFSLRILAWIGPALLAAVLLGSPAWRGAAEDPAEAAPGEVEPPEPAAELSGAEILARIQQIIDQDEERLKTLEARASGLAREYEAVGDRFNRLDAERAALAEGPAAAQPSVEQSHIEQRWRAARDEFDLVLQQRQAVDRQLEILTRKVAKEREALDFLASGGQAQPLEGAPATPDAAAIGSGDAGPQPAGAEAAPPQPEVYDRRVADARRTLAKRDAERAAVERRARLVESLISLNEEDLAQARAALVASRDEQRLFEKRTLTLTQELAERAESLSAAERAALERRVREAERQAQAAATQSEQDAAVADSLALRVEGLRSGLTRIAGELVKAENGVEAAQELVAFLQSPFAPHRIVRWAIAAAPRILFVVVGLVVLWIALQWLTRRLVSGVAGRNGHHTEEERQQRIETVQRAVRSGLTIAFVIVGVLAILPEFGVHVGVLLGGAAVFSVALAFGAQNLLKDYFYGFIILMENQYRVGNVVKIGDTSGLVEDITLRMTTLRDLDGVAHFIPHGQINSVSNLTHGWSRVVLEVGVAYKENVDRVMEVLMDVAREMSSDPDFKAFIVDEPEMLGVDAFADSAVVIKFLVRTRPLKQWVVKRELLRRIKNRFDELGIEIPFPHRTVYHRSDPPSGGG